MANNKAVDVDDAVKKYAAHKPDLVTMDITMPKSDGIEALKQIKKIEPNAKIIMISSSEMKTQIQDSMKLGAIDYLVKPINRSNLSLAINKALRRK